MENDRILISGAGIAGLTLAFWLRRHGFAPTVIEAAPGIRGGGYMIDLWGVGYDVVERMGILDQVAGAHYEIPFIEFVDERNRVGARLQVRKLRELIGWRHFNLLRSDLERILYAQIQGEIDIRFATAIAALRQTDAGVEVDLASGATEGYDLVIGADGLRSNTRRLVFGGDEQFERYLGYYVASFTMDDATRRRDVDAVSQVRMPRWSRGRVSLVGDACQCVSLVSGQGSALAMAGAYVLAGELARAAGRHTQAFERYESIVAPEIARKQEKALRFARSFVPSTRLGIFVRDAFVGFMFLPIVSKYFIGQFLADDLKLENYG